jgi:hypothetical protein
MTPYEQGFAKGERDSFFERRFNEQLQPRPRHLIGDYMRGYWDGYTPRSQQWAEGVPMKEAA